MPTHLTESDVRSLLDTQRLIHAIELAFRDRYPAVRIHPRIIAPLATGIFLSMSCHDPAHDVLGMKVVVLLNPEHSASDGGVHATYFLLDTRTSQPRLIISANYLTDLRTAATSAVATKLLAREDVQTLGIFGTGRLARAHIQALPLVRPFQRVLICGRTVERSRDFVQKVSTDFPALNFASADSTACARESDVLCTCTSNSTPLFDGRHLRPGTHLNLLGGFQSHVREVDTCTVLRSRVIVETHEAARNEIGEVLIPQKENAIGPDHVAGDLHELVSGKIEGRKNPEEITLYKSVGCALEDLVAAEQLVAACASTGNAGSL